MTKLAVAIAFFVVMFTAWSSGEPFSAGIFDEPWDKLAHMLLAALLMICLLCATRRRYAVLCLVVVSLLAALEEFHQLLYPARMADTADWLAGTLGAALITLVAKWRRFTGIA